MRTITTWVFISFTLLFTPLAKGQEYSRKSGISMDEMNMSLYYGDPKADAVVLFDIGKSSFVRKDNGFYLVFEDNARIKIFRKSHTIVFYDEFMVISHLFEGY